MRTVGLSLAFQARLPAIADPRDERDRAANVRARDQRLRPLRNVPATSGKNVTRYVLTVWHGKSDG